MRIKIFLIAFAALFLNFNTRADILIYNYSSREKVTQTGRETTVSFSGRVFYDSSGTFGTFVGWIAGNGYKLYWVTPFSNYIAITIPGAGSKSYTMIGAAGQEGQDPNGYPHLWSYLHKGQNVQITIATGRTMSFPKVITDIDTHVYPDAQTGLIKMSEATSSEVFMPVATQSCNNKGQSMDDAVNALIQALSAKGFQQE